jgi:hypothetical protein
MIGHHFSISAQKGVTCGIAAREDDLVAAAGKTPSHRRVGQCLHDRSIEPFNDVLGGVLGHPKPMPELQVELRPADLVNGGDIGSRNPSFSGQHRIGLDLSAVQMGHDRRTFRGRQIDLAGDQVLHECSRAAVRHELQPNARAVLEIRAQMRPGPIPTLPNEALGSLSHATSSW